MDWQGFTKQADIQELEKLQDADYWTQYIYTTLTEFLKGLEESAFSGTEIMAELVRLDFLKIKLVKMETGRAIYHKKTGILSDAKDNHILHEGSDNFTRAAHTRNAESVTFLYSWDSHLDADAIAKSIQQFDQEWQNPTSTFDLSQDFLRQVIAERERRSYREKPIIKSIIPDKFPAGETTSVEITVRNLDTILDISSYTK